MRPAWPHSAWPIVPEPLRFINEVLDKEAVDVMFEDGGKALKSAREMLSLLNERIGPVLARRIVEGRPYRSVEELRKVHGIGRKRLEGIRDMVAVE